MNSDLIRNIVNLRICVAFLGEKHQKNWWSSDFLSPTGASFLASVFPKTATLARVNGASSAAQICHDEHIGVGDVYHLFRLPESVEEGISQLLIKDVPVSDLIASEEAAQLGLQELTTGESLRAFGPLLIEHNTIDQIMINRMAAAYTCGFSTGEQVYPYYRSKV